MKYLNDINYKDCVGKVCKSSNSGDFKVLKYNDAKEVEVRFVNTGYETVTQLGNIRNGKVKDSYSPSVYDVGISGAKYPISEGGVETKEYALWKSMLRRCYSDNFKKKRQTYIDCKCSENFNNYEYFYEWCQNQIGFNNKDWHLDKNLLIKGNKVYSEDSCIFIPQDINLLLTKCTASRGKHLIGVHWHKTRKAFRATVNKNKGKQEQLGLFKTELEAFNAYKQAKEAFVKEQANKWKGKVDDRAYEALMSYEVNIDD